MGFRSLQISVLETSSGTHTWCFVGYPPCIPRRQTLLRYIFLALTDGRVYSVYPVASGQGPQDDEIYRIPCGKTFTSKI